MTFEKRTTTLGGKEIGYWEGGEGEPLLYLHPAGGAMLTDFLGMLAKERKIYIPVIPGFDGTDTVAGLESNKDLAGLVAEFIGTVVGGKTDVMGVSFGGWTALWLAVLHPDLVDLLVLEAPAGLRFGQDETTLSPEASRANLFAYPDKAASIAPTRERAIANGQAFAGYMKGVFVDEELAARLPEIQAQTLVLMATKDITIPAETGRFIATRVPKANVTYIYDAAHALEVDQPERTLTALRPFLARGPAFIVHKAED
jgi:pimeloyl-ACP methyl ester carboxylesterase